MCAGVFPESSVALAEMVWSGVQARIARAREEAGGQRGRQGGRQGARKVEGGLGGEKGMMRPEPLALPVPNYYRQSATTKVNTQQPKYYSQTTRQQAVPKHAQCRKESSFPQTSAGAEGRAQGGGGPGLGRGRGGCRGGAGAGGARERGRSAAAGNARLLSGLDNRQRRADEHCDGATDDHGRALRVRPCDR